VIWSSVEEFNGKRNKYLPQAFPDPNSPSLKGWIFATQKDGVVKKISIQQIQKKPLQRKWFIYLRKSL
jgi:hypothetical protein